MIFNEHVYLSP